MANFFEETVKAYKGSPKKVVNWITGELLRRLNQTGQGIGDINLLPAQLAELLYFVDQNRITNATAKEIFEKMIQSTKSASELISELDLVLMSQKELEKLTETVIKNNQKAVADFKNDKKESLDFLIGQVQRLSKGKADPALVRQLLLDKLKS